MLAGEKADVGVDADGDGDDQDEGLQRNSPGGEGSTDRDGWDQRGDDLGDRGRVWRRQRVRLWSGGLQVRRYTYLCLCFALCFISA